MTKRGRYNDEWKVRERTECGRRYSVAEGAENAEHPRRHTRPPAPNTLRTHPRRQRQPFNKHDPYRLPDTELTQCNDQARKNTVTFYFSQFV